MLSTAAVLGSGCDADLLRAVSGRGELETVEALDEAVRRFLLTETPPAGDRGVPSYDFPYEALREVAYSSATRPRLRLGGHRRHSPPGGVDPRRVVATTSRRYLPGTESGPRQGSSCRGPLRTVFQ